MPVIWLLDAYRAGERGQVRALVAALAAELGARVETIALEYRSPVVLPHVLGLSTLRGITADSAARLRPPWPDLVVTSGVRNEPVCRWIRDQSGGHTRYLHLGRPWAGLESFDLVVTTPQYRVPARDNVLNNTLTLHNINERVLAEAAERWRPVFADLPGPRIAIIVGGDSGPFTFGPRAAQRLAVQASRLAADCGGSLLVSTSSRSSSQAMSALEAGLQVPNYFYRWQANDPDNPYLGMLALADRLVVTGDSIAMLSEACATGKPVSMFDLGGMRQGVTLDRDFRWGGFFYGVLMRFFWQKLSRDITLVHRQLRESGRADWLDEPTASVLATESGDMSRAVAAVRSLLGETVPGSGLD